MAARPDPLPRAAAPAPAAWQRHVEQLARHRRFAARAGAAAVLVAAGIGGALLHLERPLAAATAALAIAACTAWAVIKRRPTIDVVELFVDLVQADPGQRPPLRAAGVRTSAVILQGPWAAREAPQRGR